MYFNKNFALHRSSSITLRPKENTQTFLGWLQLKPYDPFNPMIYSAMEYGPSGQCPAFLSHGIEEILKQAVKTYSDVQCDLKL